jgi:nitrate reductase gamma subunit
MWRCCWPCFPTASKTEQPTLFSARLGLLVGSLFATVVNLRSTEAVLGRTDDFTLVDKIHITIAVYVFVAAVSALLSRRLCERDRAAFSRRVDNVSLIVTAAILLALNVVMISNAVISK